MNGHGRHTECVISELNGRPARTPVNASPRASRSAAHDSGTERLAGPYSVQLFHLRLLAGLRRFPIPPVQLQPLVPLQLRRSSKLKLKLNWKLKLDWGNGGMAEWGSRVQRPRPPTRLEPLHAQGAYPLLEKARTAYLDGTCLDRSARRSSLTRSSSVLVARMPSGSLNPSPSYSIPTWPLYPASTTMRIIRW